MFYFLYLSRIFLVDVFIFYGGRATPSITASTLHFTQSYHFPCSAQSRMAASFSQICYYQSLFKNKVRVNTMYPPKRLRLADLRGKKPGVFEPQSSRCLAYLNESPPHSPTHPRTIPKTACGLEQEALCLLLFWLLTKCERLKEHMQGYQRVRGDTPPPAPPLPNGTTLGGELVTDPPIHGFILSRLL